MTTKLKGGLKALVVRLLEKNLYEGKDLSFMIKLDQNQNLIVFDIKEI